jgi:RHS repeat-associated protein
MESRCEPAQEDVGCLLGVMLTLAGLPFQVASPDHAARACPESSRRGNQGVRNQGVANQEQYFAWDAENRLVAVTYTNRTTAGGGGSPPPALCGGVPCKRVYFPLVMNQAPAERYSYDADGARVRRETKTEVTRYIGPHFEVTVGITNGQVLTTTKSYDFGGQRIAVRQNGTLSYLHGDHLGSTSVTTSNTGATTNNVRYFAYGGQRMGNLFALPTDHGFTDQKLDKGTGLMDYGARYYDSALGMFVSPDSIVPEPGNPLSLNRYSYVLNNPLRFVDPTGHKTWCPDGICDDPGSRGPAIVRTPGAWNRLTAAQQQELLNAYLAYALDPGYYAALYAQDPSNPTLIPLSGYAQYAYNMFLDQFLGVDSWAANAARLEKAQAQLNNGDITSQQYLRAVTGPIVAIGLMETAATVGQKVYRVFGNRAKAYGRSWTPINPQTVPDYANAAGLPAGNSGKYLSEGTLTDTRGC